MRASALAILLIGPAALGAVGCDDIEDAGAVRQETRSVPAFERIEVGGRADVNIRPGSHAITLHGGERMLEDVTTTVEGETLEIGRDGHWGVREELDAVVNGLGDIRYRGDPTVRSDVSGLGDVGPAG